jgi:amino acid transporter
LTQNIYDTLSSTAENTKRFGTFGGVFTPSVLTILGVVMYMLLPSVVGNVGLGGALIIIAMSHCISFATGLSVSSISTNRTVGAGGAYFMISRALGAPAGAAIGIPLFFAQALSVAFYVKGFTESIRSLLPADFGLSVLNLAFSATSIAVLTCVGLLVLVWKSSETAIKAQYFVMGAIVLSLISIALGGFSRSIDEVQWFVSDAQAREMGAASLSETFAIFFPAVTGIMAGVSMSGDLKDARRALPRGTLFAILAGFIVYMALPFVLALNFDLATLAADQDANQVGTQNYSMFNVAAFSSLVYVGLWGATLSSAMGSILSAPRTVQALAMDGLMPRFLAKGHGPSNEPRAGVVVTFALAVGALFLGDLEILAQILSMFFLATYGITNLACFLEIWAANPSFRPTFKISPWISLAGAFGCFYVMSLINFGAMVASACICLTIYLAVQRRALHTTFGDARHGFWSALVRTALNQLHKAEYHDQNWRPNLLIFGGALGRRSHLLDMGMTIVQERGITSYIEMLQGEVSTLVDTRKERLQILNDQRGEHQNVFFRVDIVPDVYQGVVTITQSYGIGSLGANSVMLGWLSKVERAEGYFKMLRDLSGLEKSLLVMNYDENRRFGRRKNIHIWWGGLQANGGLMLLLAYLTISYHRWNQAKVTILTVVDSEETRVQAVERLNLLFESARLDASAQVILREGRSIRTLMSEHSGAADLAVLGLRLPDEDEDLERVFEHYNHLLEVLPTTILVHSAGSFDASPVLFDGV